MGMSLLMRTKNKVSHAHAVAIGSLRPSGTVPVDVGLTHPRLHVVGYRVLPGRVSTEHVLHGEGGVHACEPLALSSV